LVRGIKPESLPAETDIKKLKAKKSLTGENSNSKKLN
jgi:hypothetical protein